MWWIYFDTSSKAGSRAISQAENPGLLGAYFHYVHVVLVGAIIVCAVANELVIAHPNHPIHHTSAAVLLFGPASCLLANTLYKRLVYHHFPLSHLIGLLALAFLYPLSYRTDLFSDKRTDDANYGDTCSMGKHFTRQNVKSNA